VIGTGGSPATLSGTVPGTGTAGPGWTGEVDGFALCLGPDAWRRPFAWTGPCFARAGPGVSWAGSWLEWVGFWLEWSGFWLEWRGRVAHEGIGPRDERAY